MAKHLIYNGDLIKNEAVFTAEHPVLLGANCLHLSWFVVSSALPFYQDEFKKIERFSAFKGIRLPEWMTANTFAQDIRHLFQMNRIYQGGLLKMLIYSENLEQVAKYLMTAEVLSRQNFLLNEQGLKIDIFRKNRLYSGSAEIYDVGVSATETSALNTLFTQKLDQIVLLNEWNHVARFIGANFMMVRENVVYTPALEEGAINDVMREKTIEACERLKLSVFDDCIIHASDIKTADEIFVLNPVEGLKWVIGFEDKRYYFKLAPKLADMINRIYFGKIKA
jgi:hypothetical protein